MQNQHLKLKEIVWEITGECHNNCKYCGSKQVKNKTASNETIKTIALAIAKYPPEEINISGGDPLIVEPDIHADILKLFHQKNIVCKLIVSPNSLVTNDGIINQSAFDIIQSYDWIGISINNKKELEKFKSYKGTDNAQYGFKNFTIITNFNIQNLYDFDLIERFVKEQNCMWTIQFTVYDDPNNPLSLYHPDNEAIFNYLKEKYQNSKENIILSDNIRNDVPCGAGRCSIGITNNGIVIPCLSMRSWAKPADITDCYNIIYTPLKEIWINGFKKQRFGAFKCCKDACNNKCLEQKQSLPKKTSEPETEKVKTHDWNKILEEIKEKYKPVLPTTPWPGEVVMYGVASPKRDITNPFSDDYTKINSVDNTIRTDSENELKDDK